MKAGVAILVLLAMSCLVFTVAPSLPKAHAVNPTSNQTCYAGQPLVGHIVLNVANAGDAIVVMSEDIVSFDTQPAVASVIDSFGSSFVATGGGTDYDASITSYFGIFAYRAVSTHAGVDTITWTNSYSSYYWCTTAWDVSGDAGSDVFHTAIYYTGLYTGTGTFDSGSGGWTPKVPSSNATILAALACACGTGITAGTDYTMVTNHTGSIINDLMPAESSPGNIWASDLAPINYNGGPFYSLSMAISIQPQTIKVNYTAVVACNFYQLQCWWEPLIFYGMYSGLWVGVGASMKLKAKSLTYLFAVAVSYASAYLILLGELPYEFAIMAFIGAFVYGLRLDGVF